MHASDPTPAPPGRLHALDNLRAIMMWLGIVLHVVVIYAAGRTPLFWHDRSRTVLADVAMAYIHAFRMPVFFILAGFFVVMLATTRGTDAMLRNRVQRLALPFAVFWPLAFVATGLSVLAFLSLMATGHWGLDESLVPPNAPRGANTIHLWFVWMLLWFSVIAALLLRLPRQWFAQPARALVRLGLAPWGFAVLALPLVVTDMGYPDGFLAPTGSFLPPWNEWVHNGLFFVFGLCVYGQQATLFERWQRTWRPHLIAGSLLFVVVGSLVQRQAHPALIAFAYHCCGWLLSFAALGLGLRFLAARQPVLAYLADSAYWVYIAHFPFTVLFGALLYELDWPAIPKILVNIALTSLVCLASYQLFVRHSWISVLLNGKRHPRASALPPAAATAG